MWLLHSDIAAEPILAMASGQGLLTWARDRWQIVLPVATVDLIVDLLLPPEPFFSSQTADEVWRAHP